MTSWTLPDRIGNCFCRGWRLTIYRSANYIKRTFTHVAESSKLRFAFTQDDNLPLTIHTDVKRLQQVINNLLSNAFKYTEHGVVGARISLVNEGWNSINDSLNHAIHGVLAFAVTDTGIGIPLDKQQIIFKAFQQSGWPNHPHVRRHRFGFGHQSTNYPYVGR